MPRMVLMTWVRSQKRWTKMYKGTRYYVSPKELGCEPTEAGSVNAANEWWRKKLAEIQRTTPIPGVREPARRTLEAYTGEEIKEVGVAGEAAAQLLDDVLRLPVESRITVGESLIQSMQGGINSGDVKEAVGRVRAATVGRMVAAWVALEKQRMKVGKVSGGRADMNRICLCHFRDWIGENTPVTEITGAKWTEFYTHLLSQMEKGVWGESHVDRIWGVSKRFIRSLWEQELIELPRNLDSRTLSFTVAPKQIEVFSDEELQALWEVVKGQSRLHVLLMLNCGMLAKDINDLRQDEVDWDEGTITRKRSKTSTHRDVPVVRYKLWAQTFDLLKKWRSADPEVVLLTQTGRRWIEPLQKETSWQRSDSIASCLRAAMKRAKVKRPVKCLRATASSKLAGHKEYKFYAQYFLGQSPRSIADKHYVVPNDREFFLALDWLEKALGL